MGLLSKLTTIGEGSTLSYSDGITPLINPLAGGGFNDKNTSLHYSPLFKTEDEPDQNPVHHVGYSVDGTNALKTNLYLQQYEDGKINFLPLPTKLDLLDPINVDPNYKPKYTPLFGQTYSELYNTF
jgi:hypothetical protein